MSTKLLINKALLEETLPRDYGPLAKGAANPIWGFVMGLLLRGYHFKFRQGSPVAESVAPSDDDYDFLTVNKVVKLCGDVADGNFSQEVENWPTWIKILDGDMTTRVPAFLTNPFELDQNGDPTATRKRWSDWAVAPRTAGGYTYVELNSGGAVEPGSVVARLVKLGATILTSEEVRTELG